MAAGDNVNTDELNKKFERLGNSANDLAGRFGSLFVGAPKTINSVTAAFEGLIPGARIANRAIKGFEGYVGVLQQLSSTGIHFNNQIDEMILQAGAANMQIGDLARVAQESSEQLAQLGAGANAGLQNFLARQAAFYEDADTRYEQRLKRLGMTVDDINDRFMQYDMLQAISNVTERQATVERNKRATEFAEEMDRLAKLTGRQADELAKAVEQTAREGRVFAATQLLPELGENREDIRGQFATDLTDISASYGPAIGNFMKDMVTQGFPSPNDPAMLAINSFAPELANTFETYNQLMKQGRATEARGYLDSARMQIERLRTDRNFLEQVRVSASGASEYATALGEVSTQLNSSIAVSNSAIAARLREQGKAVTDEAILAERNRMIAEAQGNQQRDAQSGSAQVYQGYLDSLTELQKIARTTQEITVRTSFGFIEDGVRRLADNIAAIDMDEFLRAAATDVREAMENAGLSSGSGTDARVFQNLATTLQQFAGTFNAGSPQQLELNALRNQMSDVAVAVQDQGGIATRAQEQEMDRAARRMQEILAVVQTLPEADRPRLDQSIIDAIQGYNNGTMGVTGRLFKNFGQETITALHGLESVTTPDQMADIVRSSSAGTMQALVDQFNTGNTQQVTASMAPMLENFARTNISALNGMLNTVRTQVPTAGATPSVEIDLTALENAIMKLPTQFKQPVEEALNSTLKPAMEQVAANTSRGAEYTERTYKNTRGMGQDYMRGA